MKSNENYVFSLIYYPTVGALLPKRKILFEHARRLRSRDYFDVGLDFSSRQVIFSSLLAQQVIFFKSKLQQVFYFFEKITH